MNHPARHRPVHGTPVLTILLLCSVMFFSASSAEEPDQDVAGSQSSWERFPAGMLFPDLLADPRSPRTHVTLADFSLDDAEFLAGMAGFAANFGLFRRIPIEGQSKGTWQISLAGGVNALFDMDASSRDLMDANYQIGVPVTWRRGNLALRGRAYHISAHQGDDFLMNEDAILKSPVLNMSFEAVEAMASWDRGPWTIYGGATKMVRSREDLLPYWLQAGVQGSAPLKGNPRWRWVAGLDLHSWQETAWNLDIAAKGGMELSGSQRRDRAIRFLAEIIHGRSPYYQFYNLKLTGYGLGMAFVF